VVESNGTLARHGTGVVESKSLFTGAYEVVFDRDVSGCAFEATLGDPSDGGAPAGEIGVATREFPLFTIKPTAVFVEAYNSSGTATNNPFHLAVLC
jgi:hypothetical protein